MALNLIPSSAPFPPSGPTSLLNVIPSYLYQEFSDDDDLQAFVFSQNTLTQIYVDWFNNINLPIYTGLSEILLDWVGQGLYGIARPTLYSNQPSSDGLISWDAIAALEVAQFDIINNVTNVAVTNDDVYKRVLTWHFYKGDGKQFSAQWLRRRVLRFLYGADGGDYNQPGNNVSLIFGGGNLAITIVNTLATTTSDDLIAGTTIGALEIGECDFITTPIAVPSIAPIFCEAINTGALELPAKFTVTCQIGAIGVI